MSKGAAELRKFLDHNRVNRVILLSDGLAWVVPDGVATIHVIDVSDPTAPALAEAVCARLG